MSTLSRRNRNLFAPLIYSTALLIIGSLGTSCARQEDQSAPLATAAPLLTEQLDSAVATPRSKQQAVDEAERKAARQAIVVLRDPGDAAKLARTLPPGHRVVSISDKLVLIENDQELTPQMLEQLGSLPGVEGTDRNYVYFKQGTELKEDQVVPLVFSRNAKSRCELTQRCPGIPKGGSRYEADKYKGVEKHWAQRRVNADLMLKEIEARKLRNPDVAVYVAVLDTGFDPHHQASVVNTVSIRKGVMGDGEAGNPEDDVDGHGTMVTGTIVGKDGMGVGPNSTLSVYRVTKEGANGSTSDMAILNSMKKACDDNYDPDGVTILNLSWGGRDDERGKERDEDRPAYKGVLNELTKKGCVITKSAGNSSFHVNDDAVNGKRLDDNYLRVSATDYTNNLSYFSSTGEVAAPGMDIYTLEATMHDGSKNRSRCGDEGEANDKRFVNGTSFSAPITAGIASEVVGVLKSGGVFAKLSPESRISLLNRTLRASMKAGIINGLRAVLIADRWNAQGSATVPSVEELKALVDDATQGECQTAFDACSTRRFRGCGEELACFEASRRIAAMCANPGDSRMLDLMVIASQNDYLESGIHFFRGYATQSQGRGEAIQESAEALLEKYYQRWSPHLGWKNYLWDDENKLASGEKQKLIETRKRSLDYNVWNLSTNMNVNALNELLPYYLEGVRSSRRAGEHHATVATTVRAMFESGDLANYLTLGGSNRGSEPRMDFAMQMVRTAGDILGDKKILEILRDWIRDEVESAKATDAGSRLIKAFASIDGTHLVMPTRILDRMITSEQWAKHSSEILEIEESLLDGIDYSNAHYPSKPPEFVFFFEKQPNRSAFLPLIDRHREKVRNQIQKAIRDGKTSTVSALKLQVALDELDYFVGPIATAERSRLYTGILSDIGKGRGWGSFNNEEFLKEIPDLVDAEVMAFNLTANLAGLDILKKELKNAFEGVIEYGAAHSLLKAFSITQNYRVAGVRAVVLSDAYFDLLKKSILGWLSASYQTESSWGQSIRSDEVMLYVSLMAFDPNPGRSLRDATLTYPAPTSDSGDRLKPGSPVIMSPVDQTLPSESELYRRVVVKAADLYLWSADHKNLLRNVLEQAKGFPGRLPAEALTKCLETAKSRQDQETADQIQRFLRSPQA